ncbi:LOW QUALITY PROTEIN: vitamin K-dependent protein S [Theristicus caerulescens]
MRRRCGRCLPLLAGLAVAIALAEAATFLSQQYASQFLVRKRRANSFYEESKGNLERESMIELSIRKSQEIFVNNPETEYFYPKYLRCLASHRAGVFRVTAVTPDSPADLRACVSEISNCVSPLPCHKIGYENCLRWTSQIYMVICKPGWHGEKDFYFVFLLDINECEDVKGVGSQRCSNLPSYRCLCEECYFISSNKRDCEVGNINECVLHPNICGTALENTLGKYECECAEGYTYNATSKNCEDIDECSENICAQLCVNSPGSYSCYCDGKKGFKLSKDMKNCESVTACIPLNLEKNYELLYLAEQFIGIPVLYLKFKLPNVTRFTAEFDFRTYDAEGVILYAESLDSTAWILLAVRDGKIEIQFKNEFGTKVTSGGKAINDGLWHIISVEELEHSISVKIAKEAVMSINSAGTLFKQSQGFLETKVYIAGLPHKVGNTLVKQINPRLDGCIRAWNLMNQGHSGVKEVIQEKQSKHCLVAVGRGSFYPGTGVAKFQINYNNLDSAEDWLINVTMTIRPSADTGVMFALVSNEAVPLALSIVDSNSSDSQKIIVTIGNITVAHLESKKLCTPRKVLVGLVVTKQQLELSVDSHTDRSNSEQLSILHQAMMANVVTYLGGLPDVPLGATLVTAFYNGCMEVKVNNRQLDLDEAISKHNDIRSHSCPLIMQ